MLAFIISLLALVAICGLLMGCDMLRDRTDGHTRFVGGVMLSCSLVLSSFVALLLIA